MIKYNHLVANLLVFHTAVGMTRALENMAADGFADAISPEALTTLSPYQTEHCPAGAGYEPEVCTSPSVSTSLVCKLWNVLLHCKRNHLPGSGLYPRTATA